MGGWVGGWAFFGRWCLFVWGDRDTDINTQTPLHIHNHPPFQQILAANERDLANARESNLAGPLLKRLALSEAKIATLADGITALADVRMLSVLLFLLGLWCI